MTTLARRLSTVALLFVAAAIFASPPALAKSKSESSNSWSESSNSWSQPRLIEWFQYVVKFTCGVNSGEALRVVPGVFATAVSLYNFNSADVTLRKNVALTYPPEEQASGEVSDQIEDIVSPGTGLQVDCEEIRNEFVFPNPPPATDLVQGFLVIESRSALHVEAVYTAAGTAGDVSVDVERIAERKVSRPLILPTLVAICHYPPGNPSNRNTIFVDASAVPAHLAHGDSRGACNVN
ncbi:MAG TPA: hypothetical protein VII72_21090 [Myxococcota bacterium]|jgi:hypothetical protein